MNEAPNEEPRGTVAEVFRAFLRLGLTCFGGPVAHLSFFHGEFVLRRRWLEEAEYADLVALCQFLPGPSSSQIGMALGMKRAGWPGLGAAFLGFTLPSAALMIGFAYGADRFGNVSHAGWLRGLKLAAVAVVAQAVWTMARKLCPDRTRGTLALAAAAVVLAWPSASAQIGVIAVGAAVGAVIVYRTGGGTAVSPMEDMAVGGARRSNHVLSLVSLTVFCALLAGLPWLAAVLPGWPGLRVFSGFYRTGSLVFGGGHVVLPLLEAETVNRGWLTTDRFLAGYGAAQALPGPLFTFAAYLGASLSAPRPTGWVGGLIALSAIFLPSALLVAGVLPFWGKIRRRAGCQAALQGANAAVVGLLLAALYQPVWTSAVHTSGEFILALATFGLLVLWNWPPWLVVGVAAAAGAWFF